MLSKSLIILGLIIFSGCAVTEPVIRTEIQRVEIPISVPCKAKVPEKPVLNFPKLKQSQSIVEKAKALLADRKLQFAYETELAAALDSCIK
jgi:hypothetical protein